MFFVIFSPSLTARSISDVWPRGRLSTLTLCSGAPSLRHIHGLQVIQVREDPVHCPVQDVTLGDKQDRGDVLWKRKPTADEVWTEFWRLWGRGLTVARSALVAWSLLKPMDTMVARCSSEMLSVGVVPGPELQPGITRGAEKSAANHKRVLLVSGI